MGDVLLLVLCAGIVFGNLYVLWKVRTDDTFLREYVRTSPKAWMWRRAFGEERAGEMIRRFVPLSLLVWIAVLALIATRVV